MRLEWNPSQGRFVLFAPRLMVEELQDEGFTLSETASTYHEAVFFTEDDYAAVTFWEHATPAAAERLRSIRTAIESSWARDCSARYRTPDDRELWPFQRANVRYILARRNALCGDQPGLGKTPTAIVVANELRAKRILVICPASIRLQWETRIREWSTIPFPCTVHTILHSKHGVHPYAHWTIVSYELATKKEIGAALAAYHYDLLVLDEAHYCKTVDAERTRAIFGGGENRTFAALASRAEHTLALTGTPLPNRPREAYTLARGLCWDAIDWASEASFRHKFNPSMKRTSRKGKAFIDERSGRHAELQNRMRANFMCRHEKRDVLTQLKMPAFDFIYLDETGPIKAALKAERMLDIDPNQLTGADMAILGQISVVRKMMGLAMAPGVAQYIDMLVDGGTEKLVVFGWHVGVLDIWERHFQKHGVVRVDGSTGAVQKNKLVSIFVNDPSCKVIIGNILSLGTGTDGLQDVCSHCVIGEVSWVPGENQQAVDRLDRGGQRHTVQCDLMVVRGSFAERVVATSLRKLDVLDRTLDRRMVL